MNPSGPFDKLCLHVFYLGAFAQQYGTLEAFLKFLKEESQKDSKVMREWKAALDAFYKLLRESDPQRLGKSIKALYEDCLSKARKKVVEAWKKSQRTVKSWQGRWGGCTWGSWGRAFCKIRTYL